MKARVAIGRGDRAATPCDGAGAGAAPGHRGSVPAGDDDLLVGEFQALREAVAEQLRAAARLEVALGRVQGEVARKAGPEAFKETFATLRQDVAGLAKTLERQDAAFRAVPDAAAIGSAVEGGVAGLARDFAQTRVAVREAAAAARRAAEEGRELVRYVPEHARRARGAARRPGDADADAGGGAGGRRARGRRRLGLAGLVGAAAGRGVRALPGGRQRGELAVVRRRGGAAAGQHERRADLRPEVLAGQGEAVREVRFEPLRAPVTV